MVCAVLVVVLVLVTDVVVTTQEENILDMFPEYRALKENVAAIKQKVDSNTHVITPMKRYIDKRNPNTAFMAYHGTSDFVIRNGVLKFDQTSINIGNAYNRYTGVFTANKAGLYSFSLSLVGYCGGSVCVVGISQNGETKHGVVMFIGPGNQAEQGSSTVVLNLSIGDRVYVESSGSTHVLGSATNFAGYLI